ncbi:UNVERIFIED_CONTAM: hypothetical protein NCL1_51160 [Trichonephila clavipes]
MSFARRPGSAHSRQTSRREAHHIVRNASVQPTASSAAIHTEVEHSLGALCLPEPYEGTRLKDIWDRGSHYYKHMKREPATFRSGVQYLKSKATVACFLKILEYTVAKITICDRD